MIWHNFTENYHFLRFRFQLQLPFHITADTFPSNLWLTLSLWQNYIKGKSQFLLDCISLLPLSPLHFKFKRIFNPVTERSSKLEIVGIRIMMLIPISNLLIQASRIHSFFSMASQAKSYNQTVRTIKYVTKALLEILVIIYIGGMVWMQGSLIFSIAQSWCLRKLIDWLYWKFYWKFFWKFYWKFYWKLILSKIDSIHSLFYYIVYS